MKKLLLTGFDPFGHYSINPSWEAVKAMPDEIEGLKIHKLRLPNIYDMESRLLLEAAEEIKPDIILMTGMNSSGVKITVDFVAINIRDALLEDNLGRRPWNVPVIEGGPAAYFATIPAHELVAKLKEEGMPVKLAYASGGFICNDVFYSAAHHFHNTATRVGFVHVPCVPEMVFDERMALPLQTTVAVLERIIAFLARL